MRHLFDINALKPGYYAFLPSSCAQALRDPLNVAVHVWLDRCQVLASRFLATALGSHPCYHTQPRLRLAHRVDG